MFYCQILGKLSKLGESPRKILLAKRVKTYTKWVRNDENAANISHDLILDSSPDNKWLEVFVSRGWEIVKEVDATLEGEALWNTWDSDQRWLFIKKYYPHLIKQVEESDNAAKLAQEQA